MHTNYQFPHSPCHPHPIFKENNPNTNISNSIKNQHYNKTTLFSLTAFNTICIQPPPLNAKPSASSPNSTMNVNAPPHTTNPPKEALLYGFLSNTHPTDNTNTIATTLITATTTNNNAQATTTLYPMDRSTTLDDDDATSAPTTTTHHSTNHFAILNKEDDNYEPNPTTKETAPPATSNTTNDNPAKTIIANTTTNQPNITNINPTKTTITNTTTHQPQPFTSPFLSTPSNNTLLNQQPYTSPFLSTPTNNPPHTHHPLTNTHPNDITTVQPSTTPNTNSSNISTSSTTHPFSTQTTHPLAFTTNLSLTHPMQETTTYVQPFAMYPSPKITPTFNNHTHNPTTPTDNQAIINHILQLTTCPAPTIHHPNTAPMDSTTSTYASVVAKPSPSEWTTQTNLKKNQQKQGTSVPTISSASILSEYEDQQLLNQSDNVTQLRRSIECRSDINCPVVWFCFCLVLCTKIASPPTILEQKKYC
jgi:hypothetical protein